MLRNCISLCLFISLVALLGCGNADYSRNKDGLVYHIVKSGSGPLIKPKTHLKIHQTVGMDDTTFFSTFGQIPAYGFFDSLQAPTHDFLDILHEMRIGDSAIIIRSVDTLVKRGMVQYNERFKEGSTIKVIVKVLGSFENEMLLDEDRKKEMEAYKQSEIAGLGEYLKKQNLKNVNKTTEGVYVVVEKEGNGPKVDSGMYAVVNYTGALKDGKVFDSNVDSTFGHTEPFEFLVGVRQVIEGWDIGVQQLRVGSKAKLYIPSMLGYGMQAQGPKIPAFSDLVFDIEVLEVKAGKTDTQPGESHDGQGH